MSAENLGLGRIIVGEQARDAIHVAVVPVVAGDCLSPGAHVVIVHGKAWNSSDGIGVVDPYLRTQVFPGQKFWLFLNPGSITSLRHDWTHPDFPDVVTPCLDGHRGYLENVASEADISYDELLRAAKAFQESREFLCDGGRWDGFYIADEFWTHYQAVTGESIRHTGSFFTCDC